MTDTSPALERNRTRREMGVAHALAPMGRRLWRVIRPRLNVVPPCPANRFFIADRAQFQREEAAQPYEDRDVLAEIHAGVDTRGEPLHMISASPPEMISASPPERTASDRGSVPESPPLPTIPRGNGDDLLARLRSQCRRQGPRPALIMEQEGLDLTLTYGDLWRRASRIAGGLVERGVEPGDRIAILSESRPEWAACLLAGWLADAVIVPLDHMLEEGELLEILDDSAPRAIFISEKFLTTARSLGQRTRPPVSLYLLGGRDPDRTIESICDLEIATPRTARNPDADGTAMIVYTSGTMGRPKGVVTRFSALLFQVTAIQDRFHLTSEDRFLSILPLNHLLELTVVLLSALHTGGSVIYASSLFPADILRTMRNDRVTIIVGVPIFFRALRNNVVGRFASQALLVRSLFRAALWIARYLPVRRARRLLFFPLYWHLGGSLRFFASGGAYLEPSVARFFERLGIPLLQGYGLTETGPVISVNGLGMNRAGSVGKPLPGVDVRIDRAHGGGDGEILTRGRHVMAGYYRAPGLADSAVDEAGWFRTGDIGELDADGYLYVTGRRKNVIVLDSGKNVQPEEVEETILECPIVRECCVIGRPAQHGSFERTEEVCAVVVPTEEFIARHDGDDDAVQDEIEAAVMKQVRVLAAFKRPAAVEISLTELPKSPIQKIKRNDVRERFGGDRHCLEIE